METKKVLHLALNFEKNYLVPFYVFVTSALENNYKHALIFHVITSGLTEQDEKGLEEYIGSKGGSINFYAPTDGFAANFTSHGFGKATFYRLLFADLLPIGIEKFLYIDVDTIIVGDLYSLYAIDTQTFPIAAVAEPAMESRPELGLSATSIYFNAGVLLINRVKWIEQRVSERAINFLNKNHAVAYYADQDALNATLVDNWLPIDSKFNLMRDYIPRLLRKKDVDTFLNDKIVIHFTQFYKPWHTLCNNKLRFLYYNYLKLIPIKNNGKPIDYKLNIRLIIGVLRIRFREAYYDYPIIPVSVVDNFKK